MWPRLCPVCGDELPTRGNRRLRVPGSRLRLVHAGACAEAIEAQTILDLEPPAGMPTLERAVRLSRRWYVVAKRIRAELQQEVVHRAPEAIEAMLAVARHAVLAERKRVLVRGEEVDLAQRRLYYGPQLVEIARRAIAHERQVCGEVRTELFAWPEGLS